jgi:AcrR family transcriptional regulator
MSINENDSRVIRTKKLIREGLVSLIKEKSINKITVKELTDRIEINRGTFYLHYKDVIHLIECIENELYAEFDAMLSSYTAVQLLKSPIDVCEAFCAHFYEHRDIYAALLSENGDAKFSYKVGELMNEKVYSIFKSIFPNMDKTKYDFTYNYSKFGLTGLIYCWFTEHPEWTPRKVAELWLSLTALGLWGILGDEGKEILINAYNSH